MYSWDWNTIALSSMIYGFNTGVMSIATPFLIMDLVNMSYLPHFLKLILYLNGICGFMIFPFEGNLLFQLTYYFKNVYLILSLWRCKN